MAWVVDVSRCLGLIELNGCTTPRQTISVQSRDTLDATLTTSRAAKEQQNPITSDVLIEPTSSIVTCSAAQVDVGSSTEVRTTDGTATDGNCISQVSNSSETVSTSCNMGATATTNHGGGAGASSVIFNTADAITCTPPAATKTLDRLNSLSTPCLFEKRVAKKSSLNRLCSTRPPIITPSLSINSLYNMSNNLNRNFASECKLSHMPNGASYTKSCEILSPETKCKYFNNASKRRVILTKGDTTVQYSPMPEISVPTEIGNSGNGSQTPTSSHRHNHVSTPPNNENANVRNALVNRVCGTHQSVPPLPATEHPNRPPKLSSQCTQHANLVQEQHALSTADPTVNYSLIRRKHQHHRYQARKAVKSTSGLSDAKSWSEQILAGNWGSNVEIHRHFGDNRTSSMRGPPSRAASAGFLFDALELSEVSVGDSGPATTTTSINGATSSTKTNDCGTCTIPIIAPNVNINTNNKTSRTSQTSLVSNASSSLDSTNTSVTTISYGGPPESELPLDDDANNPQAATSSSCTTNAFSNRNSFHVSPPFPHNNSTSTINNVPAPRIRRCQSDVTCTNNNNNNNINNNVCGSGNTAGTTCPTVSGNGGSVAGGDGSSQAAENSSDGSARQRLQRLSSHDSEVMQRTKSLKRSKGSTHLRRSVSQPLDLNKSLFDSPMSPGLCDRGVGGGGATGLRRAVDATTCSPYLHPAATHHLHHHHAHHLHHQHYPQRRPHRRPSTGNLLTDETTTSEEEAAASSDNEDRRDRDECSGVVYAEALWDHVTLDTEELVFCAGELISVVDRTDPDWWWGRIHHRQGWFPVAFVRLLVNQQEHLASQELIVPDEDQQLPEEDLDFLDLHNTTLTEGDLISLNESLSAAAVAAAGRQYNRTTSQYSTASPRKNSASGLSHDQIRANVIKEIITTERDFVKHLRDVVEGYLKQARRRPDMFSECRVAAIFGNMEALFAFQTGFLRDLEACIDWDALHSSCVGEVFIKNSDKFEIYSEYCNNHPFAVSELQELYTQEKYVHFFEACRLLQEMIDISLDGFLLTPVQKICKYPLQLQELLKYTKPEHPDRRGVEGGLGAMRGVALLVNERRRRMECLEKLAAWQMTLEGWEGPELLDTSSQLIHQGEVVKGVGSSWSKEVTLFLFDRQLVYCKKDLIKRNTFVYRGRINLDHSDVEDLMEPKDGGRGSGALNAWKIHCHDKNKVYIFSCKTHDEKLKWLDAFRRERELVAGDEEAGFLVSAKARQLAREAARTRRARPKKPRTSKVHKRGQALTHAQAELLVNIDRDQRSNSLPSHQQQQQQQQLSHTAPLPPGDTSDTKRRGLWFSFGGQKKSRSHSRSCDATTHQQQQQQQQQQLQHQQLQQQLQQLQQQQQQPTPV